MKRLSWLYAIPLLIAASRASAIGDIAEVSIYDRTEHKTLPVYVHEGRYFVAGRPGNSYEIVVRNAAGQRVLAVVSVDGVNAVSGETADWAQSGYVLDGGDTTRVRGWRKSLERIAAFYFTRLDDSYAARTGRPDNVGVIGVALFRERIPEPPIPYPLQQREGDASDSTAANEASAPKAAGSAPARKDEAARSRAEKSLGTGHGRSETSYARYTTFERESDSPTEVIAIHYDSYDNLLARGVISSWPELASPFPGQFVPDP